MKKAYFISNHAAYFNRMRKGMCCNMSKIPWYNY